MANAIVIPSFGRKAILEATLGGVFPQMEQADRVVVVTCRDVDAPACEEPGLLLVQGTKGSACQRNSGLDSLQRIGGTFSSVLFIDDDVVLAEGFLANLRAHHAAHPEAVGFTCHVIADGSRSGEITRSDAEEMARIWEMPRRPKELIAVTAPYVGFSMRGDLLARFRFDERLAGYGFMEDWDFFARLRMEGRTGFALDCGLVHLAVGGGRTAQRKFGFSQITNPLYLRRKGVLPRSNCARHVLRALASNLRGVFSRPKRERLQGNLLALWRYSWVGPCPELVDRIAGDR